MESKLLTSYDECNLLSIAGVFDNLTMPLFLSSTLPGCSLLTVFFFKKTSACITGIFLNLVFKQLTFFIWPYLQAIHYRPIG